MIGSCCAVLATPATPGSCRFNVKAIHRVHHIVTCWSRSVAQFLGMKSIANVPLVYRDDVKPSAIWAIWPARTC